MENEQIDYQLFYWIPFPFSQKYEELDENHEYCSHPCEDDYSGVFADKDWVDMVRQNLL